MKRELLKVLLAARRGDVRAQYLVGCAYLHGRLGIACHPAAGIRYLAMASASGMTEATHELVATLTLDQFVQNGLIGLLRLAASGGVARAQYLLGLWLCTQRATNDEGLSWLRSAARQSCPEARLALAECLLSGPSQQAGDEATRILSAEAIAGNSGAFMPLARAALARGDIEGLRAVLPKAVRAARAIDIELATMIVRVLCLELEGRAAPVDIRPEHVRAALQLAAEAGNPDAMLMLGSALIGMNEPVCRRADVHPTHKRSLGLSLLMRASDLGKTEASLVLADFHGQRRGASYSRSASRYYLERAAACDIPLARIRLAAILLHGVRTIGNSVRAIELLQPLAIRGDREAAEHLTALVLPVTGTDDAADQALRVIAAKAPLLAARLSVSRWFGLKMHETLTMDIVRDRKHWGILVDPAPFFVQRRKRAVRAVPALSMAAVQSLSRAAQLFDGVSVGPGGAEGEYRHRLYALRSAIKRCGVELSMFCAQSRRLSSYCDESPPVEDDSEERLPRCRVTTLESETFAS